MEGDRKLELLGALVAGLCAERGEEPPWPVGAPPAAGSAGAAGPSHSTRAAGAAGAAAPSQSPGEEELWAAFRALVNTRPPWPADAEWLAMQDELLQAKISEAGVATLADARPAPDDARLALWRGDITTLAVDAIVNAANSQMLGCWVPGHHCFAGVQLRIECAGVMEAQGHDEPTGAAKMTGAYNLPSGHVIHTVGPIANGRPTDVHREQLASCYRSCLDLAAGRGLRTIAFCCISTGVFGFPQREAAGIAVRTVRAWLDAHPGDMTVVFNVFGRADEQLYQALLGL